MTAAPTTARRVATASRIVAGIAVITAVVGGTFLAIRADLPGMRAEAASSQVLPASADTVLACAGPFRALGRDASDAQLMQSAGTVRIESAAQGTTVVESSLDTPTLDDSPGTAVFTAEASERGVSAASQSLTLRDEDVAGFAASACRPAAMQAWLVGGSAAVGTSDVLSLANPGEVPSTVTITVFGADQQLTSTVVVPAFTQTALPLASIAIGQSDPVVFVSAEGAPVRAALQSSIVRTLDPGGIDWQDSAGTPEREIVLAGVQVTVDGSEEGLTVLRLMATEASTSATVSIRRAGSSTDAAEPQTVPLAEGIPAEIGFPGLAAGVYTVEVTATEPVVAAAWQATGIHSGSDFAWMTPAPLLTAPVIAGVPRGAGAGLHLVAEQPAQVRIAPVSGGTERTVSIDAGSSVFVEAQAGESYLIESDTGIRVAVVMSGDDALAGWPLWPGGTQAQALTIYP